MNLFRYTKPGDWLVFSCGLLLCLGLILTLWRHDAPQRAIIRSGGKIFAEVRLPANQSFAISGPLGTTFVSIRNLEARISSDPSPRQYCVKQGWLKSAGETAVCLPNQVSLELLGRNTSYDSLNY
ncbi:MAG TPA: NusG domain II-containing protein [Burkholderiales bacterium]|nr:NusG domain II-containing protein [Burkholderiales bacterium]